MRDGRARLAGAFRSLLAAAVLAVALPVPAHAAATAAGPSRPGAAVAPDPLRGDAWLQRQRAGYGDRRTAAARYAHARAKASALPRTAAGLQPLAAASAWLPMGPTPLHGGPDGIFGSPNSGRVTSLAVAGSTLYVGTASGGVWRSTDGGHDWSTTTDQAPTGLAIGALAVDPANAQTVYAGTGEDNVCADCFYGEGILSSHDGGSTWSVINPGGVFTGVDFSGLAVDPHSGSTLYAATTSGLFVSTDGGNSFALPSTGFGYRPGPVTALAIDPGTTTSTLYIAVRGAGIQKSGDGGTTWTQLGNGIPSGSGFGEAAIAVAPSNAAVLYASVGSTATPSDTFAGLYKSTNHGASWARLSAAPAYTQASYAFGPGPTSDQVSYDNVVAVDPAKASHVLAGGVALVESTDGGSTWTNVNGGVFTGTPNRLHPDFHALLFNSTHVLAGCDGGVYDYDHATNTVANLNSGGLDTTQVYPGISVLNNGAVVLAGMQDNGTALYTGQPAATQVGGGDGAATAIAPGSPAEQFEEANQRLFMTTDSWQTASTDITPPYTSANAVPPLAIAPGSPSPTVYFGGDNLYATTNPSTTAGATTWTARTAHPGSTVSAITVSPSDPGYVYAGFSDGTLLASSDGAQTFTTVSIPDGGNWITHIAVDPSAPGSIAVTVSNSDTHTGRVPPQVLTATGLPGAAAWTDDTGNLPGGVASNAVIYAPGGGLDVATDVGVFAASPNGGATAWSTLGSGLPNVQALDLVATANGTVVAATHGRGLWELPTSQQNATVVNFAYTGRFQPWTVAAGVTWIQATMISGSGGAGSGFDPGRGGAGGSAGRWTFGFTVNPGETLLIGVGGNGTGAKGTSQPGTGGWNGGGNGAPGAGSAGAGGGGGGASSIAVGSTGNRVAVLEGGGGGGGEGEGYQGSIGPYGGGGSWASSGGQSGTGGGTGESSGGFGIGPPFGGTGGESGYYAGNNYGGGGSGDGFGNLGANGGNGDTAGNGGDGGAGAAGAVTSGGGGGGGGGGWGGGGGGGGGGSSGNTSQPGNGGGGGGGGSGNDGWNYGRVNPTYAYGPWTAPATHGGGQVSFTFTSPDQACTQTLAVSPTSAKVGHAVRVTGDGFGAGTTVDLFWDLPYGAPIRSTPADPLGSIDATNVKIPAATGGMHTLFAVDRASACAPSAPVTVLAGVTLSPTSGAPGSTATATVSGFSAGATVNIAWGSTGGTALGSLVTNGSGGGQVAFTVPPVAAGKYHVTASSGAVSTAALYTVT